jgi:transcriptional regulator with XRE-family HTH domain
MDYRVELGKAIRAARMKKGYSIQDVHYQARIAYKAITDTESGRSFVKLDTLLRICQVLQVKPSSLFAVVDEKL